MVIKPANSGAQQQKRAAAEEMWLKYYNSVLFEKGLISERERNIVSRRIDARAAGALPRFTSAE